jgi:hypothetical protein
MISRLKHYEERVKISEKVRVEKKGAALVLETNSSVDRYSVYIGPSFQRAISQF